MVDNLADVSKYAKFQGEIFSGYDFTRGRISLCPIDFCMDQQQQRSNAECGLTVTSVLDALNNETEICFV